MAPKPLDAAELLETARQVRIHGGSHRATSKEMGITRSTIKHRIESAIVRGLIDQETLEPTFEIPTLPSELIPTDELVERRKRQFKQKNAYHEARKLIPIRIKLDGPIGICHMGDPHVDDDGTDLELLESIADTINKTPGMYGASVGDMSNNWVGRLARLYAEQSTSAAEAWQLVEWFVGKVNWLYLIGGNHDCWSGAGDPIQWMTTHQQGIYEAFGARMALNFPNGREVRINARHDFKGHSQWNTAHGPSKAVQMGWRDHILTCGHTHVSGYQVLKDPSSGLISHALRIASFKTHDRYAIEKGLPDQNIFNAPVTVIDPEYGDDDKRLVTTFFDPFEASEYLKWKRRKKS